MSVPQLAKAQLMPMHGDQVETDKSKYIIVQFNPATLRLTLSNTLNTENAGASSSNSAQYVGKSESSLAVELVFDTTVPSPGFEANTDVRKLSRRIAEAFMKPVPGESQRPKAPTRCRFQWGSFQFTGMLASYGETLDFFAPEGIPLRSTLALTFKEDSYQFEFGENLTAGKREQPTFSAGGDAMSAASVTLSLGADPKQWRALADFNGLENPRVTPPQGVLTVKTLFK